MDPNDIQMKTGFSMNTSDDEDEAKGRFIATTMGLMQVFSEEALKTAAHYVIGSGRTDVTDEDILKALKFQARMFFQRVDDLEGRVEEATQEILESLDPEEEATRETLESLNSEEDDESDEESDEEYESDSDDMEIDDDEKKECTRIVYQVDSIVKSWDKYNPDDPILQFIKSAIDKTEVNKDEDD